MVLPLLLPFALLVTVNASSYSKLTCVLPTATKEQLLPLTNCPIPNGASSNLTLNELINERFNKRIPFPYTEDIIFLKGEHIVNGTIPLIRFAAGVRRLRLRGQNNVVIICNRDFYFHFDRINGDIKILNLQFQNCIGKSGQYRPTLYFVTPSSRITLNNIRILNDHEGGEGIIVYPESSHVFTVNLYNSFLSTGGTGFYSSGFLSGQYRNRIDPKPSIQISNMTFSASCLELQTGGISYTVKNTTFTGCKCSPVLSFHGKNERETITLNDIQISGSTSSSIIQATKFSVILKGTCIFHHNAGTLIFKSGSNLIINGANVMIFENYVFNTNGHTGTILIASNSLVYIRHNSSVVFKDNSGQDCGGITLMKSGLILSGNSTTNFISNTGHKGGALSLYGGSVIRFATLESNTGDNVVTIKLNFESNSAIYGGAIYVEDEDYIEPFSHNFTRSIFVLHNFEGTTRLHFVNNTASFGGDHIYGGWIGINIYDDNNNANTLDGDMITFEDNNDVASDPTRVCMCTNNIPNCSNTEEAVEIFPGQTLSLEVVAVGQRYGTVKTFISAIFLDHQYLGSLLNNNTQDGRIDELEKIQSVERSCTLVNYTIFSSSKRGKLVITPFKDNNIPKLEPKLLERKPELALLFKQFSIIVSIKDCPLAFHFDTLSYRCTCLSSFPLHNLKCDSQNLVIIRTELQWVGLTYIHTIPEEHPGIIAHQHCPYDYCRRDRDSLSISMEQEYHQCAFDRYGIMCGACKPHFSQIFGSSKCIQCSNNLMILVIILGTLLAGIALVVFLMVLNLTVSVGTINSLIFYANIVQAQHTTFFNPSISSSFFSKFIAWLNLDLGIETCFYNGLDAYGKMWLQFLFPLYIWTLVIAIIISSHYSSLASRLSGRNSVQVLATLFLLSYTKIIQIAITVFSSTTFVYPDGYVKTVWLYDGNIDFLSGRHIGLFVFTMFLTTCFVLLYTLSLVTIQWLLRVSHYRIFFWVQKLKPCLDAYTGPYKINHRYWTGVLLIARVIFLVTFSLNRESSASVNLLVIIILSFALIMWLYFARWVYMSPLINVLEVISLCNLCLTSVVILFELSMNRYSPVAMYISSGFAFTLFIVICTYHAYKQECLRKIVITLISKAQSKYQHGDKRQTLIINEGDTEPNLDVPGHEITRTVVELSELLLQDKEHKQK